MTMCFASKMEPCQVNENWMIMWTMLLRWMMISLSKRKLTFAKVGLVKEEATFCGRWHQLHFCLKLFSEELKLKSGHQSLLFPCLVLCLSLQSPLFLISFAWPQSNFQIVCLTSSLWSVASPLYWFSLPSSYRCLLVLRQSLLLVWNIGTPPIWKGFNEGLDSLDGVSMALDGRLITKHWFSWSNKCWLQSSYFHQWACDGSLALEFWQAGGRGASDDGTGPSRLGRLTNWQSLDQRQLILPHSEWYNIIVENTKLGLPPNLK